MFSELTEGEKKLIWVILNIIYLFLEKERQIFFLGVFVFEEREKEVFCIWKKEERERERDVFCIWKKEEKEREKGGGVSDGKDLKVKTNTWDNKSDSTSS